MVAAEIENPVERYRFRRNLKSTRWIQVLFGLAIIVLIISALIGFDFQLDLQNPTDYYLQFLAFHWEFHMFVFCLFALFQLVHQTVLIYQDYSGVLINSLVSNMLQTPVSNEDLVTGIMSPMTGLNKFLAGILFFLAFTFFVVSTFNIFPDLIVDSDFRQSYLHWAIWCFAWTLVFCCWSIFHSGYAMMIEKQTIKHALHYSWYLYNRPLVVSATNSDPS